MSDNSDLTSLRPREYLNTLRAQLGSDLATSERIPQYTEDSTWSDLAMSERIPQYAKDSTRIRPRYEREYTSVRWGLNLIWPRYVWENTSVRWGLNSDLTSLRAREYLSTLRTKLESDLATCERISKYVEDSTRIQSRYVRENTSVRWGLNSNLTSLQAREYLSTLRTKLGSDLATRERIP